MSQNVLTAQQWERARELLCALQNHILEVFWRERAEATEALHGVADITVADTIYRIDKISEVAILKWFAQQWPQDWPVEIVMEGLENLGTVTFPEVDVEHTILKCIIDPIDGTRPIMYDKRPAWVLMGLAPQRGPETSLRDIVASAMTELPTTKQWRADQLSAVVGGSFVAESINVLSGQRASFVPRPSTARDLEHGFAAINRFFPEGLVMMAEMEAALWRRLQADVWPVVFTDQYLTTGGQLYDLMTGRDRFIADLRPWVFDQLGVVNGLTCHPYDIGILPIAAALGVIVENPVTGELLDAPLDTTSPVGWAAYANRDLHALISPHLKAVLAEFCPQAKA